MSMSSRIGVMEAGRITQIGAPTEIYEHPRSRFVADFIGSINLFEGRVASVSDGVVLVTSDEAGCEIAVEDGENPSVGSTIHVGVRPEKLTVVRGEAAGSGNVNRIAGEVLEVAYLGERSVLHVRTRGGKVIKVSQANDRRTGAPHLASGDPVHVTWAPSSSILLSS